MKLVIAEKPSVAQSLAAVIGATVRKDGYLEGNGWRVSWCVGHLAGLADADSYDPKYAKWRYDDLPILPEHWQMVVGKDKKKQFDILKKLMNAPDVTEVVNACDAGREGELIFRSVYELAGCQKPMKRLWISSMEDSAIREGFANLRPGVDYDGLRDAALCRAKADWLVGINATRLFSVLYHRTLNIGRVMSPTLALIVQREAEIDTFKPVPFYTVALELPGLTISGERMVDKAAAEQLKEACQGVAVTIKKVERKEKSEKPPALYDLTTLQRDANRLLGFTAQQTLDYLQSLYEKKLCTYPRTDSRYLTGDMADSLPVLVNLVANAMPFRKGIAITCDPQTVINDKKVTEDVYKRQQAERQLEKANVNVLYQKSLQENPQFASNPLSRWQQKQAIKKQYAAAKHAGQTAGNTAQAASKTGKAARTVKEKVQQAGAFVMRHKKGFLMAGVLFLITCMLMNTMSSCSMMAQSIGSVLSGTT